jgi:hypothetical protein
VGRGRHGRICSSIQRLPGRREFLPTLASIAELRIVDVGPVSLVRRSIGIFRDSPDGIPVRERVLKILRGFRLGEAIPPVAVVACRSGSLYKYELTDGTHRFYCSLVAGFTHVPAVKEFDRNAYNVAHQL